MVKYDVKTNYLKVKNKILSNQEKMPDQPKQTWQEFQDLVSKAHMDTNILNAKSTHPAVREAALESRKYLQALGKEARGLGMFASQKAFKTQLMQKEAIQRQITKDLKVAKNPVVVKELKKLQETLGGEKKLLRMYMQIS